MSDWDTVTILRKKAPKGSQTSNQAINTARRTGAEINTEQKCEMSKTFFFTFFNFKCVFSLKRWSWRKQTTYCYKEYRKAWSWNRRITSQYSFIGCWKIDSERSIGKGIFPERIGYCKFFCCWKYIERWFCLTGPGVKTWPCNLLCINIYSRTRICFLRDVLLLFTVCIVFSSSFCYLQRW